MKKNKGYIVQFKQFGKIVQGKVEGFLGVDYTVELLEDAPPLRKGMIISVEASKILS